MIVRPARHRGSGSCRGLRNKTHKQPSENQAGPTDYVDYSSTCTCSPVGRNPGGLAAWEAQHLRTCIMFRYKVHHKNRKFQPRSRQKLNTKFERRTVMKAHFLHARVDLPTRSHFASQLSVQSPSEPGVNCTFCANAFHNFRWENVRSCGLQGSRGSQTGRSAPAVISTEVSQRMVGENVHPSPFRVNQMNQT